MRLRDIDLNLLLVFEEVYKDRRVSQAAEDLDLSQPAVSAAMNRLRNILGEDLFVRSSRGMLPTPFAEKLHLEVAGSLHRIQQALNQEGKFDPATSSQHFAISLSSVGEVYFLPKLITATAGIAPQITITAVLHDFSTLAEDLADGRTSLAVGALPGLKGNILRRHLFTNGFVCVFRAGHPLDKEKISLEEFASAQQVLIVGLGKDHARIHSLLEKHSRRGMVRLRVSQWASVADILRSTDLVATVPAKFGQRWGTLSGLKYLPHPLKLPEANVNLYWHARFHKDPANQWLRTTLFNIFSERHKHARETSSVSAD